jgi:hypothetical protein
LVDYVNKVVGPGYLKGGDISKLFSAPGCNLSVNVAPGPPEVVTFTSPAGTSAIKVHPIKDADVSNTIFATSRNYTYNNPLPAGAGSSPYGQKGFIVMHKGGDGIVFRQGQAIQGGWADCNTFQTNVGRVTGDTIGVCAGTDPANTLVW